MKNIRLLLAVLFLAGSLGIKVAPVSADDNIATDVGVWSENYVLGDG